VTYEPRYYHLPSLGCGAELFNVGSRKEFVTAVAASPPFLVLRSLHPQSTIRLTQPAWSRRARQRQGTHKTKGRGEVRKTTRKPWNQKGSGRARAGDLKAPHHVGGGNAHPIRNRDYSFKTNRRVRNTRRASLSLAYPSVPRGHGAHAE